MLKKLFRKSQPTLESIMNQQQQMCTLLDQKQLLAVKAVR